MIDYSTICSRIEKRFPRFEGEHHLSYVKRVGHLYTQYHNGMYRNNEVSEWKNSPRPIITLESFHRHVIEGAWYVNALRNKTVDYWNFNCCTNPHAPKRYAVRTEMLSKMQQFATTKIRVLCIHGDIALVLNMH